MGFRLGTVICFKSFKKKKSARRLPVKSFTQNKMNKTQKDALFRDASILVSEVLSFVDRLERELK